MAAKGCALEAAIAQTMVEHEGAWLSVGVSAGYALLGPGDEPKDIIFRADRAMYVMKGLHKKGRLSHLPSSRRPVGRALPDSA